MPRYFFNVHNGFSVDDEIGRELPDLQAAKAEAVRIAGGFAANPNQLSEDGGAIHVVIREEVGKVVGNVRMVLSVDEI